MSYRVNDLALAFDDKPAAGVWEDYIGAKRNSISALVRFHYFCVIDKEETWI